MNSRNKKDVIFGNVELDPDTFAAQHVKERITTMVDQDALEALKRIAKERNLKYQTLLNQIIRSFVGLEGQKRKREPSISEDRIRKIVREELKKRA